MKGAAPSVVVAADWLMLLWVGGLVVACGEGCGERGWTSRSLVVLCGCFVSLVKPFTLIGSFVASAGCAVLLEVSIGIAGKTEAGWLAVKAEFELVVETVVE